ncbi:uncharacterized protein L201_003261 [Kwoniella dendrophila CBS 6074]|uniref:BZIP domain-containing protein n=1 Tax=Kwoniella dendrophila CBS 6074 TaxID=1295534 RepID=A0AAX4JSC1_9TREE
MSSSSPILAEEMKENIAMSAYRAAVSQHIYSLLQAHKQASSSSDVSESPNPDASSSSTRSRSRSPSPGKLSSRRSTLKASKGESLLDPNLKVEVLVNNEIKPDQLKVKNVEKFDNDNGFQLSSSSSRRRRITGKDKDIDTDNISSRATLTNTTINGSQAESGSNLSVEESGFLRGRSRVNARQNKNKNVNSNNYQMENNQDDGINERYRLQRSENYEFKRKLKFAKNRNELENKINTWWNDILDALPEGSSNLANLPAEFDEIISSPSMSPINMTRSNTSTTTTSSNSQSSSSLPSLSTGSDNQTDTPSAVSELPPLIVYDSFPTKNDQLNSYLSATIPKDILPSPSLGLGIFTFNIAEQKSSIDQQQQQNQYLTSSLTFSTKACKATLKGANTKSFTTKATQTSSSTTNISKGNNNIDKDSKNESLWLFDALGNSDQWEVPPELINQTSHSKSRSRKSADNESRSKSPMKVIVTGEMPTPKPIASGQCLWG